MLFVFNSCKPNKKEETINETMEKPLNETKEKPSNETKEPPGVIEKQKPEKIECKWIQDTVNSDDIIKYYNCKIGNTKLSKGISDIGNEDYEAECGLISIYSRNINRDGSGDGLFINTNGILDEIERIPSKRYKASIVFKEGVVIKRNKAAHMVYKANGFPTTNHVDFGDLNESEINYLRGSQIEEVIIGDHHISIENPKDIIKAASIVWFNSYPQ